ncbi:MAG: hypothetical protein AAF658_11800 [Myxococcota bacterium]
MSVTRLVQIAIVSVVALLSVPKAHASAVLGAQDVRYRPDLEQVYDLNDLLKIADPRRQYGSVTFRSTVRLSRPKLLQFSRDLRRYREAFFDYFQHECRDPGPLHILVIPLKTLNDARNFGRLPRGTTRLGAYHIPSRTLFLTPESISTPKGKLTLAHEIAHHYYSACGFSDRGEREHVRIYSFQHHLERHGGKIKWPSTRKTNGSVTLPGLGDESWPIIVESEGTMRRVAASRLAQQLRTYVTKYARSRKGELRCRAPWPLRIRLVPWRGFGTRGYSAPRVRGQYFSAPNELYFPVSSPVSKQVVAREAAYIVHTLCAGPRPPDPNEIATFAASAR